MLTEAQVDEAIVERRIPKLHQGLYRRAHAGHSRQASIKAMCLECQGWDDGAMQAVRECEAIRCPLHSVRPYQTAEDQEDGHPEGEPR